MNSPRPQPWPGYWMYETGGALKPAVQAYLEGAALSSAQIGTIKAYLRQWILHGAWIGAEVEALRREVEQLESRAAIAAWLDRAMAEGIDPL